MQNVMTPRVTLDKYGYNCIARQLFLAAQTTNWTWAWVYSIATFLGWLALSLILARENPGLLNQRSTRTKDLVGTKHWDWVILSIYVVLLLAVPITAGLDYRYGWSAPTSPIIHIFGIVLLLAGFVPLTWAVNRFFEGTVRIKANREHTVIREGPYRCVRHPGYVGVILHFIAPPLALGTWTALIPALLGVLLFIIRTALEDAALRSKPATVSSPESGKSVLF
jgi:protein-S-isoprenylcysteine O-methyltransferase Ste14